jgi:hypothetical protein
MMGEETFHPDTRALLAYGRALAGAGVRPKKGGADHVLERLFVIERKKDGRLPIRTFGAELVNVFGRDLKEHDLSRYFLAPDLAMIHALIRACEDAGEPGIVRLTAESACGKMLSAEMLLTPLKVDTSLGERFLGLFQALGGEAFLGGAQIQLLRVGSLHPPMAKMPKSMRLVVVND